MAGAVLAPTVREPMIVGRYALFDEIASGGMATVHLGRLLGPVGFGRTVAVKRLHEHYLADQEFVTMFMDEARVAARIQHQNVVPMVDVVQSSQGLFLIMEYVHGESLSRLVRGARTHGERLPVKVVAAAIYGALMGLHAAHETKGPSGELLGVVHRDVSPQNIMVGADGVPRVLDFGIAKAAGRAQVTREGQIKGKLAYMAPEQVRGQVDRRTDVFSVSVCMWEALCGKRMHEGLKDVEIITRVMSGKFTKPSVINPEVPAVLDDIVLKGLHPDPNKRFASAREMAIEIDKAVGLATPSEVSAIVERLGHDALSARSSRIDEAEKAAAELQPRDSDPPPSAAVPASVHGHAGAAANGTGGTNPRNDLSMLDDPGVDVDVPHGTPLTNPSLGTNAGTSLTGSGMMMPEEDGKLLSAPWLIALAASALLAIVGAGLGAYAILHKKPPPPAVAAPPSATPQTTSAPTTTAPTVTPPSTATAAPPTSAGLELDTPPADTAKPAASATATASAAATTTATATATTTARPAWTAPPATATAKPKKNCDPPFTVDEQNHKHYKPECFDTF